MGIKQVLYNAKKRLIEKNTPKKQVLPEQKIIVIDGCDLDRATSLFASYVVTDTLDKINRSDYGKICAYFGSAPKNRLKEMTGLEFLQLSSAGLNGYDNENLYSTKPLICTAKGIYGLPISECVIADILFLIKPALSNTINTKHKIPPLSGLEFTGSKIVICGLGDIGRNIAARCKGMKCSYITGVDVFDPKDSNIDKVIPISELESVLSEADFIVSALPDLPETRHLFNIKTFSLMKQNAIFINVGRGTAVDQDALLSAIKSRHLFGAALDVTTPDPLPKYHALRKTKRVIITDHLACISKCNQDRLQKFYLEQCKKYVNGDIK